MASFEGHAPDERGAAALFSSLGVPMAPMHILSSQEGDDDIEGLPYPVVVRVLSADITHKTEAGGVVLNVRTPEALRKQQQRNSASAQTSAGIGPTRISPVFLSSPWRAGWPRPWWAFGVIRKWGRWSPWRQAGCWPNSIKIVPSGWRPSRVPKRWP